MQAVLPLAVPVGPRLPALEATGTEGWVRVPGAADSKSRRVYGRMCVAHAQATLVHANMGGTNTGILTQRCSKPDGHHRTSTSTHTCQCVLRANYSHAHGSGPTSPGASLTTRRRAARRRSRRRTHSCGSESSATTRVLLLNCRKNKTKQTQPGN